MAVTIKLSYLRDNRRTGTPPTVQPPAIIHPPTGEQSRQFQSALFSVRQFRRNCLLPWACPRPFFTFARGNFHLHSGAIPCRYRDVSRAAPSSSQSPLPREVPICFGVDSSFLHAFYKYCFVHCRPTRKGPGAFAARAPFQRGYLASPAGVTPLPRHVAPRAPRTRLPTSRTHIPVSRTRLPTSRARAFRC